MRTRFSLLISLSGIFVRNTLIMIEQIHDYKRDEIDSYYAVFEAILQRSWLVIITAMAAFLAFALPISSLFWRSMAVMLIGGTLGGPVLTLVFLTAIYALWLLISPPVDDEREALGSQLIPT